MLELCGPKVDGFDQDSELHLNNRLFLPRKLLCLKPESLKNVLSLQAQMAMGVVVTLTVAILSP